MIKHCVVLIIFSIIKGVFSLECLSCTFEPLESKCLKNTVTCAVGEVCYTTVHKHNWLGNRYNKGCKEKSSCHILQWLNNNGIDCDYTPSQCTYCCESINCNTGDAYRSRVNPLPLVLATLVVTLYYHLSLIP